MWHAIPEVKVSKISLVGWLFVIASFSITAVVTVAPVAYLVENYRGKGVAIITLGMVSGVISACFFGSVLIANWLKLSLYRYPSGTIALLGQEFWIRKASKRLEEFKPFSSQRRLSWNSNVFVVQDVHESIPMEISKSLRHLDYGRVRQVFWIFGTTNKDDIDAEHLQTLCEKAQAKVSLASNRSIPIKFGLESNPNEIRLDQISFYDWQSVIDDIETVPLVSSI